MGLFRKQRGEREPATTDNPGWDAITAALVSVHGAQEPRHWLLDPAFGLLAPKLEGLDAWDAGDHWHFVTLGLTDLREKVERDSAFSGLGYEYTMRVRRTPGDEPPQWAVRLLNRIGDTSLEGARFLPGETLDPGGPITGDVVGRLTAIGFVVDPTLPERNTPNGLVSFVQVVGMTAAELAAVLDGNAQLDALAGSDGLYVTDPTP